MSQKTLLGISFVLFALLAGFLFVENRRALDPSVDQGWWALAFSDPHDATSLIFEIDNHGARDTFRYTVTLDDKTVETGERALETGESAIITPESVAPNGVTASVIVQAGDKEQKIYRR